MERLPYRATYNPNDSLPKITVTVLRQMIPHVARTRGALRAASYAAGFITGMVVAGIRVRFNSEPTDQQALGLFLIGLPVGLALILIAIGNGFGL